MKTALLLLSLLSMGVFAGGGHDLDYLQETHYTPIFKVQTVKPICPVNRNGVSCEALGGNIIVSSTLNSCTDSIVFFQAQIVNDHHRRITFVIIYANAKSPSKAYEILCLRAQTVSKGVSYTQNPYRDIRVINHFQNKL